MATETPPRPAAEPRPAPKGTHRSEDDPNVLLQDDYDFYEPIPPYAPRTEREAEFYLSRHRAHCRAATERENAHCALRMTVRLPCPRPEPAPP